MSGFRFPNESDEYRARRDELLDLEMDLRAQVEAVAAQRRQLPLGGRLAQDYRFERWDDGRAREVPFAELFGSHPTLLLYSMMFGPAWDAPCPSCTSIVDGLNATWHSVEHSCAIAVVAAAGAEQLDEWSRRRGWTIPLVSAGQSGYILDYAGHEGASDPAMVPIMNVFRQTADGIFHSWGSELMSRPLENADPRHVDMIWPLWNLLDMTPEGRGEAPVPHQDYEHAYFSRNVLGEGKDETEG